VEPASVRFCVVDSAGEVGNLIFADRHDVALAVERAPDNETAGTGSADVGTDFDGPAAAAIFPRGRAIVMLDPTVGCCEG